MQRARTLPLRSATVIATVILLVATARAIDVPYLAGRINDTAHLLGTDAVTELEAMLAAYEDSTGNQIVLLTIETLDGESIEEYALRVAETWKLGQKGADNGALLLIAKADRKLRIEVGYGLEASLTDAMTSLIIANVITPRFKQGDFEGGIREGLRSIIATADGTIGESDLASSGGDFDVWLFLLIWFSVVGLFTFFAVFTPGCSGWGLYAFLIPFYAGPAFILSEEVNSSVGFGLLLAYLIGMPLLRIFMPKFSFGKTIATKMASASRAGGGWSSSSSGGGWSSGGSSFSGGGGSFGGGGSSGSW
ncbi:MAG: TPM domain-containing protein [Bacteroidota bacterium]|jgi:uncharacterized protein|nr:TPM domain-containing protein [Bacteroidota bacterium]